MHRDDLQHGAAGQREGATANTTQRAALGATAAPRTLLLPAQLLAAMLAQARRAQPAEACWLLGGGAEGRRLRLQAALQLANTASVGRFAVTAAAFAAGEHELRRRRLLLLGFAHSHPGGRARLSAADRAALWRGCAQLLIGLPPQAPPELAAFWLAGDGEAPLALEYSPP